MRVRGWAIAALTFGAITAWWLRPFISHLSTAIPGGGAGDNVTFVWNVWWMNYVLHHPGQKFFFTPFLFYPFGADLTLHTHTALPALVGVALANGSPVVGQNVMILVHLFLNFVCSYALAYRTTNNVIASILGALIFGTSSFISTHLNGHFNLIAAWTLPLGLLLIWNAREHVSFARGVLGGLSVAAVAYTDYYLFVYLCILLALLGAAHSIRISRRHAGSSPRQRHVLSVLGGLLLLDAVVIAGILLWPGDRFDAGPIHVSLRSARNAVTVGWIVVLAGLLTVGRSGREIEVRPRRRWRSRTVCAVTIVTALAALAPLMVHAVELWRNGGYVSQTYLWRSSPSGIDAASLVLGNPFHAVWGDGVSSLYARFHIDPIESSGWIPLSAILLSAAGVALCSRVDETRQWLIAGAMFLLWAFGPWLTAFGRQTPLILPAIAVRFLPIVANARIPGRAMVVVHLAVGILAAIGFARLHSAERRTRLIGWCLAAGLILECLPARPPLYPVKTPSIYITLKDSGHAGAVCELPFGVRDGFGEFGALDEATLLYQFVHERPLVGGFVARLPPRLVPSYEAMPVIRSFLRLSSGTNASEADAALSPRDAAGILASAGIAFIVLDTRRASAELRDYVDTRIELRRIAEENGRLLYEVM